MCVKGLMIDFETALRITELGNFHCVKSSRKEKIGALREDNVNSQGVNFSYRYNVAGTR